VCHYQYLIPSLTRNTQIIQLFSSPKSWWMDYNSCVVEAQNISSCSPIEAPSRADIKRGMTIAAQLVQRYGPKYWPVLERLKQEYDALDDREALLASLLLDSDQAA